MNRKNRSILSLSLGGLFLIVAYSACGQDYNSLSGDRGLSGALNIDCGDPLNTELCAAATGLQRRCMYCHAHSSWTSFSSSQDFIDAGLVVAGNPGGSQLVTRSVNFGGDMPPSGTPLDAAEYQAVLDWINNL